MSLSKETLELLIERSRDVVVATDRGRVDYYNDGASRVLGYRAEEILGEKVSRLYPDLDEARRVMKAMRDSGDGGPGIVENFQTTFLAKSGERIPVAISGTVLFNASGRETGTIGFAKDLRSILRKRAGRHGRGHGADHQRYPNAFFAEHGLFSLAMAHARESQSPQG